jgi:hypothetical protein
MALLEDNVINAPSHVSPAMQKLLDETAEVVRPTPPGMDDRVGNYIIRLSHLDAYNFSTPPTYDELAQQIRGNPVYDPFLPPLDRINVHEPSLTEDQKFWRDNGYIIFRNGIDPDVVDRYMAARQDMGLENRGWPNNHLFRPSRGARSGAVQAHDAADSADHRLSHRGPLQSVRFYQHGPRMASG